MDFDAFKRKVFALAKKAKAGHLIPNSDTLFTLYERGVSPADVVAKHCTLEAQKLRHGRD